MESQQLDTILRPYTPLDRYGRDIRLVQLLPTSSDRDEIRCVMATHSLDAAPPYTALSYEWGSVEDQSVIEMNDSPMHIRKNLRLFLDVAMKQSDLSNRVFWIDALCINQFDLEERSHQVSLMAEIYQGAELVISWLGPAFDDSDLALEHLLLFTASLKSTSKSRDEATDTILRLCQRSYWSRLWVLQELVLASECVMYAGEKSASIGCLEAYLGHAAFTALATPDEWTDLQSVIKSRAVLDSAASSMLKQRRRGPFATPILIRVLACGGLQCDDRKDKVYAVLGISRPSNLCPDYTVSTRTLFNKLLQDSRAFDQCKSLAEAHTLCDQLAKAVGADLQSDIFSLDDMEPQNEDDVHAPYAQREYPLIHAASGISFWWTRAHGHVHLEQLWLREAHHEAWEMLHDATSNGHETMVQMLLDAGLEFTATPRRYDRHPLHAAAYNGNGKLVEMFLDAGVDISAESTRYGNALQAASSQGHENVVQILLAAGAGVNTLVCMYGSALQAASFGGHAKIVQILFRAGADVNAQGGIFDTALQAASYSGCEEVVQMLLVAGADINAQGGQYEHALQAASFTGHPKLVQILIYAGANVNAQGGYYGNALQAASLHGAKDVVRLLINAGADVNAQGGAFGTALQAASSGGYEEVVQMLLKTGANVNAHGGRYGSALDAAIAEARHEAAETLLQAGAWSRRGRRRRKKRS